MPADGHMAELRDMAVKMGQMASLLLCLLRACSNCTNASHCADVPGGRIEDCDRPRGRLSTSKFATTGDASARPEEKKAPKMPPLSLELSYIEDAAHPDIFKISKGQF